ncbi:glycosyltransferase family 4 protein [Catenovulum sp. SX2]|uniref:glycosyltransferase family 4 protein n=1 Tax=Catenovulum sp. SX2 TaxID=3398614 RepID=UPI003F83A505
MIKVAHITYDMRIGGTEMVIRNIIESSHSEQIEHSIFCIESTLGPWGKELQQSGLVIEVHQRQPGFDVSLIRAIRRYIKKNKIDVVHCHQYTPWVYGCLAAAFSKTKVIFTEHGRFYPDFGTWKRKLVNPVLCKFTQHITAISKATKEALIEHENIPRDSIDVIYNGIKPLEKDETQVEQLKAQYLIPTDSVVLGTVARLDPIKNQQMMIEAFSLLVANYPSTYLLIVGDGEERERLHKLVTKLNIESNVIFTGYIAKPVNFIALMDVFLLSSLSEGTSMTLLEAMSLGKPCVVTDAGGNSEVIQHNLSGLVVENNNLGQFSQAIEKLLSDGNLRKSLQSSALIEFNKRFDASVMNKHYLNLYMALKSK